jgi:archaellum component FlaF (FlaF/FlaG flagellin family)
MAKRQKDKTITFSRHKIAGQNVDVALTNNLSTIIHISQIRIKTNGNVIS